MLDFFEKAYLAGLGAFSVTKDKAKEIVDELVEKGKITAEEAPKFLKDIQAKAEEGKKELELRVQNATEQALNKLSVASKSEIQALDKKLDLILKELKK